MGAPAQREAPQTGRASTRWKLVPAGRVRSSASDVAAWSLRVPCCGAFASSQSGARPPPAATDIDNTTSPHDTSIRNSLKERVSAVPRRPRRFQSSKPSPRTNVLCDIVVTVMYKPVT